MKKFRVYYRRIGIADARALCVEIEAESKAAAVARFEEIHNKSGWLIVTAVFG